MRWFKNHKLICCLIAVIAVSGGVLAASVLSGGQGNILSRAFTEIYTAIEKPVSGAAGGISDNVTGFFSYRKLQKENASLKEQNAKLKEQVTDLTLSANELHELKSLSKALKYVGKNGSHDIVSADVISMDGTNWMNIFTINCGKDDGIKEGDVVVCGEGLVGRVSNLGKNWAKVTSITDDTSKISFKLSGNLQLIGIAQGFSDGSLNGFMLDSDAKVKEGDKIITSGMGVYPSGIEIGKITKVTYDSNAQLQRITVKPSVDFKSIQKVSVII